MFQSVYVTYRNLLHILYGTSAYGTTQWFYLKAIGVCVHHMNVSLQQAEEDNEQRKRQEQIMMEKLLEQEAMMEEDQKVSHP